MKSKIWKRFDYIILISVLILTALGVMFIYSAMFQLQSVKNPTQYIKQITWASIGFVFLLAIALYDYRKFKNISPYLYLFLIVGLVITIIPFIGKRVNGARSWLGIGEFGIQPSEFGKVFFILFLAKYLEDSAQEEEISRFLKANIIMGIPMFLILLQPDLGTATVYFPICLVMCFMAGLPARYILFEISLLLLTVVFSVIPVWNEFIPDVPVGIISLFSRFKLRLLLILSTAAITIIGIAGYILMNRKKYFYWISYAFLLLTLSFTFSIFLQKILITGIPDNLGEVLLHPSLWLEIPSSWKDIGYQMKRLIVFMKPEIDIQGAGWNIYQSKIAIGSGHIFGRGYLQGTQSHNGWLPEQSTDFIFGILSEEIGFLGGFLVLFLYFVIFVKILLIIRRNSNIYGTYIASGILGMFAFHFFINIGMLMGIMPITGIPLLFLSYGGSSLLTSMTCVGFLMNINFHKKDLY